MNSPASWPFLILSEDMDLAIALLLIVSLGLAGSLALTLASLGTKKRKARRMAELATHRIAALEQRAQRAEHATYVAVQRAEAAEKLVRTTDARATAAEDRLARLATYEEILERRANERRGLAIAA